MHHAELTHCAGRTNLECRGEVLLPPFLSGQPQSLPCRFRNPDHFLQDLVDELQLVIPNLVLY